MDGKWTPVHLPLHPSPTNNGALASSHSEGLASTYNEGEVLAE